MPRRTAFLRRTRAHSPLLGRSDVVRAQNGACYVAHCATTTLAVSRIRRMTDRGFTARQGQYLAFIYYYEKVNRRSPAEVDIQRYFNVSAPSVHQMVIALEARGHIERTPG